MSTTTQHAIMHTRYLYLLPFDRASHLSAADMRACQSVGSFNLSWHLVWRCLATRSRPSSSQTCDAILSKGRRIDDFQSRPSPQREAVSSWSSGNFRAMPYLGVVAVVSSREGDIERSGQSPNAWTREITLFAYSVPSRPNHETNKPRFQFMHPWIHINTTLHSTIQVCGITMGTIVQCPGAVR
jgi:hypothetical protein